MPICITVKHGEVIRHESMIDALFDYMDCLDNEAIGLEMWWEDEMTTVYYSDETDAFLTENEAESVFDSALDEMFPAIELGGVHYDYSRAWKEVDPIAYRQGFLDFLDSEYAEFEVPLEVLLTDDDTQFKRYLNDNAGMQFEIEENE